MVCLREHLDIASKVKEIDELREKLGGLEQCNARLQFEATEVARLKAENAGLEAASSSRGE